METLESQQKKTPKKNALSNQENQDSPPSSVLTPQETETVSSGERSNAMKKVHFILQKKGGVGKSVAALMLAQYLRSIGEPVEVIDTDPSNATLFSYKALNGQRIQLMEGNVLNEAKFDLMMNRVLEEDSSFVIDCGASSFIPLSNYMIENKVADMIADSGKQVVAHTVIVGESNLDDTLTSFAELAEQMPEEVQIVVWLNEFFGKVEAHGRPFEEMNVYLENQNRVHGIVYLPKRNPATFGADIEKMLTARLTFDEVRQSPDFFVMNKSRIFRVQQEIYHQLKDVL